MENMPFCEGKGRDDSWQGKPIVHNLSHFLLYIPFKKKGGVEVDSQIRHQ